MKFAPRGLLRVGLFVALLAAVAVVSAYVGRNFTGIGPVPTRSAFAGRLPSVQDGGRRRYQMCSATNRAADDEETFNGKGSRLGSTISTGTFDVRISPYMPIEPWAWFETKNMEWAGRQELSQEEYLTQLKAA